MEKYGKLTKEHMVTEIAKRFKSYPDFFITSFEKTKVIEIEALRKTLKKDSSAYMVAKNTLLKQAIKKAGISVSIEEIDPFISGSCGVFFTKSDPASISRFLR